MSKNYPAPNESFLAGKVLKWSLPVFEGAPPAGAPNLKRMLLSQGELAQFYDAEEGIRYIAYAELVVGGVRGNHYHDVKEEFVYLVTGELLLVAQNIESGEHAEAKLQPGDLIFISTRVAHAFKTLKPGVAVEFSKVRFNAADVQRFRLM
jgi:hypothetical protein